MLRFKKISDSESMVLIRKRVVRLFQMRKYGRILKMLVGISYDKKTKKHQCIIEEYMKK